jgi:hypothetical protein
MAGVLGKEMVNEYVRLTGTAWRRLVRKKKASGAVLAA